MYALVNKPSWYSVHDTGSYLGSEKTQQHQVSSFKSLLHKQTMFFANKLYMNAMA